MDERTVKLQFDMIWDAERGWCYQHLEMHNSGFLFDTTAERDDMIAAAERVVRFLCSGVFTHAEAIEIRDSAEEGVKIFTDPLRSHRAIELLLAAEREEAQSVGASDSDTA